MPAAFFGKRNAKRFDEHFGKLLYMELIFGIANRNCKQAAKPPVCSVFARRGDAGAVKRAWLRTTWLSACRGSNPLPRIVTKREPLRGLAFATMGEIRAFKRS